MGFAIAAVCSLPFVMVCAKATIAQTECREIYNTYRFSKPRARKSKCPASAGSSPAGAVGALHFCLTSVAAVMVLLSTLACNGDCNEGDPCERGTPLSRLCERRRCLFYRVHTAGCCVHVVHQPGCCQPARRLRPRRGASRSCCHWPVPPHARGATSSRSTWSTSLWLPSQA